MAITPLTSGTEVNSYHIPQIKILIVRICFKCKDNNAPLKKVCIGKFATNSLAHILISLHIYWVFSTLTLRVAPSAMGFSRHRSSLEWPLTLCYHFPIDWGPRRARSVMSKTPTHTLFSLIASSLVLSRLISRLVTKESGANPLPLNSQSGQKRVCHYNLRMRISYLCVLNINTHV